MVAPVKQLIEQAMQLPPEDRRRLVEAIWESLGPESNDFASPEIEAAWVAEAQRRWEAYERGETRLIPAEEVFARIEEKIRQRRAAP